jgi:hypothetical protein
VGGLIVTKIWSTLRSVLKWCGIAAGSLILLALALLGAGYAINVHDEPLTPLAQALRRPPPNPYRPRENIYLALVGFDARPGESPVPVGEARIEQYNLAVDRALRLPPLQGWEMMKEVVTGNDPERLQFKGQFDFKQPVHSYWNELPPHRANIEERLTDYRELYERYRALHAQAGYFETARPSAEPPVSFAVYETRSLFLADAVLRMGSHDAPRQRHGLADLEDDLRLWRVVLTGQGSLICPPDRPFQLPVWRAPEGG